MNIITILILLINALCISKLIKIKIEEAIPISVVGVMLPIYICGLFDNLRIGIYIIEALTIVSIITIIYLLIKEKNIKNTLKQFLTPGMIIYITFYVLDILITKDRIIDSYDEFNHWGAIIKNMVIYNKFGMHEKSIITFNEYPPFTALFQYFFLGIKNVFEEDTVMIAQNLLYISLIMPIFKNITWKKGTKKLLLAIPILLLPITLYIDFFEEILVDGFMGVVFAMGIYQICQKKSSINDILLVIYITALSLTKTTGLILAVILILAKLINVLVNKENKKYFGKVCLMMLIPIILTGAWYIKLAIYKANTNWKFENLYGESKFSEDRIEIIIQSFINGSMGKKSCLTERKVGTWICIFAYVAYSACVYNAIPQEKRKNYLYCSIVMFISIIIYILGLLCMYLTIFTYAESKSLASYERYVGTIMLSAFLFNTYFFIENTKIKFSTILAIISICLIFMPVQAIQKNYIDVENYKESPIPEIAEYGKIEKYKKIFNENDKIYYFGYKTLYEEYVAKLIKYKMMPVSIECRQTEYFRDRREFAQQLVDDGYTYIYIHQPDERLKFVLKDMFDNTNISDDSLYKINKDEGKIYFKKVEI